LSCRWGGYYCGFSPGETARGDGDWRCLLSESGIYNVTVPPVMTVSLAEDGEWSHQGHYKDTDRGKKSHHDEEGQI